MKTANSRILQIHELDTFTLDIAFSNVPLEALKLMAQSKREEIDWYGTGNNRRVIYDSLMRVIKISDASFDTVFIPKN